MGGRFAENRIGRTKRGARILGFSEDLAKARARVEEYLLRPSGSDEATPIHPAIAELRRQNELLLAAEQQLRSQSEELVTWQRRIEVERRRYRDMFDLSPEAQLVTDRHGSIEEVNTAASALVGVESRKLRGKPLSSLGRDDDSKLLHAAVDLLGRKDHAELELTLGAEGQAQTRVTLRGARMRDPLFFAWTLRPA